MRHARLVLLGLALGAAAALTGPSPSRADEITFTVPVQLTNLAPEVVKGRVMCSVFASFRASDGRALSDTRYLGNVSTEFTIDPARGEYQGTVTLRFTVDLPWIETGIRFTIERPEYRCDLALATNSSGWYPRWLLRRDGYEVSWSVDPAMPPWAEPARNAVVTGALKVRNQQAPPAR